MSSEPVKTTRPYRKGKPEKPKVLAPRQLELFAMLDQRGDVPIERLYRDYYQREPEEFCSTSKMQAALGWPISTLNSRLHSMRMRKRVVPGKARGTYRLITIKPAE